MIARHKAKTLVILGVLVVVVAAVCTPRTARAAFGISPPFLNAGNLVRGSRYVQTIYLVQDQPNQDLPIQVTFNLPQSIRSWFTVGQGNRFVIPKGVRQYPASVVVQVPKDTPLGIYSGTMNFTTAPDQAGQVTIALGAQVNINLTVGDNIYRHFEVPVVRPLDVEEGWNPRIYVKVNNEGNVSESFDGATFELLDQFGAVRLAYIQKGRDFPEIPSFTITDFTSEFPTDFHLGIGQYWAAIALFQEGKTIATQKTVFNVLKRGSLSTPFQKFLNGVQGNWPYYAGGAGAVILGAFGSALMRKRRGYRRG